MPPYDSSKAMVYETRGWNTIPVGGGRVVVQHKVSSSSSPVVGWKSNSSTAVVGWKSSSSTAVVGWKSSNSPAVTKPVSIYKKKSPNRRRNVVFSHVSMRFYGRTLGDNPCCDRAPLTYTWDYKERPSGDFYIEDYENARRYQRRHRKQLCIPYESRRWMIHCAGLTDADILVRDAELRDIRYRMQSNRAQWGGFRNRHLIPIDNDEDENAPRQIVHYGSNWRDATMSNKNSSFAARQQRQLTVGDITPKPPPRSNTIKPRQTLAPSRTLPPNPWARHITSNVIKSAPMRQVPTSPSSSSSYVLNSNLRKTNKSTARVRPTSTARAIVRPVYRDSNSNMETEVEC